MPQSSVPPPFPTTDPPELVVFVNEQPVRLAAPASALAAVRALDPALVGDLEVGRAYLTDARGIRCAPETALTPGAILRVVRTARRPPAGA